MMLINDRVTSDLLGTSPQVGEDTGQCCICVDAYDEADRILLRSIVAALNRIVILRL